MRVGAMCAKKFETYRLGICLKFERSTRQIIHSHDGNRLSTVSLHTFSQYERKCVLMRSHAGRYRGCANGYRDKRRSVAFVTHRAVRQNPGTNVPSRIQLGDQTRAPIKNWLNVQNAFDATQDPLKILYSSPCNLACLQHTFMLQIDCKNILRVLASGQKNTFASVAAHHFYE